MKPWIHSRRAVAVGLSLLGGSWIGLVGCGGPAPSSPSSTTPAITTPASTTSQPDRAEPGSDTAGDLTAPAIGQSPSRTQSTPQTPPTEPQPTTPQPQTPQPPADPYQLDPAKHVLSEQPIQGRLAGQAMRPTVILSGQELAFKQLPTAEDPTERSILIQLPDTTTPRWTVRPEAPPGEATGSRLPRIDTFSVRGSQPQLQSYLNGYALTLTLEPVQAGRRRGQIVLALPDPEKSYLVGQFEAIVQRLPDEPPTPEDRPYLTGLLESTAGLKSGTLELGRMAAPGGEILAETVLLPLGGPGPRLARTDSDQPTALILTTKNELRYEFTRLRPGRYLLWARPSEGPWSWRWVTVSPDAASQSSWRLDPGAVGQLTVELPANSPPGAVLLVPLDPQPPADAPAVPELALAFALKLEASPREGQARFENLPAGSYRVLLVPPGAGTPALRGEATITAGKSSQVTLK